VHHHLIDRHVAVAATPRGRNRGDGIDDVHARDHATEHRIAVIAGLVVQEVVVDQIDEELRRRAVDVAGARHRQRAAQVLESVRRLVADRRPGVLLFHARGEAAALHHETRNHAMEDRAVVVAVIDVLQEIRRGLGGFLGIELHREIAGTGLELEHGVFHWPVMTALQGHCPAVTRSCPARSGWETT
jgi:hypothetical protein